MFRWLFLASVLAIGLAEKPDPKAAKEPGLQAEESAYPIHPILEERDRDRAERGEGLPGTGVYREIHPSRRPLPRHRIEEQNRIVFDRFSPTYSQPTWVLDYRYLKTGGRDYVRGDGGQILILPKGIRAPKDEHKQFGNFDELLEFLRLQELAEREKLRLERTRGHRRDHKHDLDDDREHDIRGFREGKDRREKVVGWQREVERERRIGERIDDDRNEGTLDDIVDGRRREGLDGRRREGIDGRRLEDIDGRRERVDGRIEDYVRGERRGHGIRDIERDHDGRSDWAWQQ